MSRMASRVSSRSASGATSRNCLAERLLHLDVLAREPPVRRGVLPGGKHRFVLKCVGHLASWLFFAAGPTAFTGQGRRSQGPDEPRRAAGHAAPKSREAGNGRRHGAAEDIADADRRPAAPAVPARALAGGHSSGDSFERRPFNLAQAVADVSGTFLVSYGPRPAAETLERRGLLSPEQAERIQASRRSAIGRRCSTRWRGSRGSPSPRARLNRGRQLGPDPRPHEARARRIVGDRRGPGLVALEGRRQPGSKRPPRWPTMASCSPRSRWLGKCISSVATPPRR